MDLLVEFERGTRIGLFGFGTIEAEFSDLTGLKVDLRTAEDLSKYFRQQVLDEAEVLYATTSPPCSKKFAG